MVEEAGDGPAEGREELTAFCVRAGWQDDFGAKLGSTVHQEHASRYQRTRYRCHWCGYPV